MKAAIRDFRGCERADLGIEKIVAVVGQNGQGKSSILQAIGCALTGNPAGPYGLTKKALPLLVRNGAKEATVVIGDSASSTGMGWPSGGANSAGQDPPHASAYAAGFASIVDLDDKERARVMAEFLHTEPTRADLDAALGAANIPAKSIDAVWGKIEAVGWGGAEKEAREQGAGRKGAWEQATGEKYGTSKAASWVPVGFDPRAEGNDEGSLAGALQQAHIALETAIASSAVAQADIDRLRETANARSPDVEGARKHVADLKVLVDEARKQAANHPAPPRDNGGMPCPHCGKPIRMRQVNLAESRIEKAEPIPEADLKRLREEFATYDGRLVKRNDELAAANRELAAAESQAKDIAEAQQKLAEIEGRKGGGDAVPKAREKLAEAEALLARFQAWHTATDLHTRIVRLLAIVEALGDNGVRRAKLVRVIDLFNTNRLDPLAAFASWGPVRLTPDLDVTYGDRPYRLLSASEQFRSRVILQIAMAQIDHSSVVLIDGADILAFDGRNQLFGLLRDIGLPSIVGMTVGKREQAPALAKHGLGATYWVERGIAEELA